MEKIKFKDYKNVRFGKLVIKDVTYKNNRAYFKCKCDCGNTKIIRASSIIDGKTVSCGKCVTNKIIKNQNEIFSLLCCGVSISLIAKSKGVGAKTLERYIHAHTNELIEYKTKLLEQEV